LLPFVSAGLLLSLQARARVGGVHALVGNM